MLCRPLDAAFSRCPSHPACPQMWWVSRRTWTLVGAAGPAGPPACAAWHACRGPVHPSLGRRHAFLGSCSQPPGVLNFPPHRPHCTLASPPNQPALHAGFLTVTAALPAPTAAGFRMVSDLRGVAGSQMQLGASWQVGSGLKVAQWRWGQSQCLLLPLLGCLVPTRLCCGPATPAPHPHPPHPAPCPSNRPTRT